MGEKLELKDVMSVCVSSQVISFSSSGLIRNNSFECRERLWWPTPGLWFSILTGILSENLDGNL